LARLPGVLDRVLTDGRVSIRPSSVDDVPALIAGREAEFERFLGPRSPDPRPVACIVANDLQVDAVVGWVDYDHDRYWLEPDEVNVGYNLFAAHRGHGIATTAVHLLLDHLAQDTSWRVATLLIHPENERSLALARRAGFEQCGDLDGNPYWKKRLDERRDGI
jgi:RimJ/RimL family protein N-acetyltransferase